MLRVVRIVEATIGNGLSWEVSIHVSNGKISTITIQKGMMP